MIMFSLGLYIYIGNFNETRISLIDILNESNADVIW